MASEYIGLQMLVTLHDPPGVQLKGTISFVEAETGLTLSNVWFVGANKWEPRVTISSANIQDLREITVDAANVNPPAPALAPAPAPALALALAPAPAPAPVPVPGPAYPAVSQPMYTPQFVAQMSAPAHTTAPAFVDPAIVTVGQHPGSISARSSEIHPLPNTSENRDPGPFAAAGPRTESSSGGLTPLTQTLLALQASKVHDQEPKAGSPSGGFTPLAQAVEALRTSKVHNQGTAEAFRDEDPVAGAPSGPSQAGGSNKKGRRQRRTGNPKNIPSQDVETTPQPPQSAGKGKGWRNTPILQANSSFQPFNSLKRSKGTPINDNGWASEDVTDVQEAGDFDFEGGLAKFDKQNIFEQMRKEDQIPDDDRLVSHNRQVRPKPGTAGGKNFHYTENVLDTPSITPKAKEPANDFWNSEADDGALNGSERHSGRELGMGSRQNSRRGEKAAATRRSQSRKASGTGQAINRVNSGVSNYRTQSARGSRPNSRLSTNTVGVDKGKQLSAQAPQGLYLLPSNRRVDTIGALPMINLENIAHNDIGLTETMMAENAGRGIAEVTLTALKDPAIKVRHRGAVDPTSGGPSPRTVVVLAGNNKSGVRAIAAARHMRNKGLDVIVCVVGLERGELELLEDIRSQVRLYKNVGGRVFSRLDFFEHLRKISIPMLTIDTPRRTSLSSLSNPAPIMLIVDALMGLAISFEDLRKADQATVYELIEWANRNEAFVLSVEIPSGIDPSDGKLTMVDGVSLYMKSRYVVALGAPKKGLLEAMAAADNDDSNTVTGADKAVPDEAVMEWKLFLVDIGLGPAVWKRAGAKMRKGIDFEDKWVLEMRYQGLAQEDEDAGEGAL